MKEYLVRTGKRSSTFSIENVLYELVMNRRFKELIANHAVFKRFLQ